MTEVLTWSWRVYPAAALVLLGAGLVTTGLGAGPGGGWQQGGPERALIYLHVFRRVVVGLALVGAGVAWAEQVSWLLAACVCIGIGELLESSYYIGVLRWGPAPRPTPTSGADRASGREDGTYTVSNRSPVDGLHVLS